ncbi:ec42 protein [Colletotrichum incanum]|uniref:Ec42 protein n=1 Tax=Colletotrichum incanum TaxID=1573173 RepID=A0A162P9T5_COLIC|nr:ec42 protein [Colletotrichum incanum]OHW95155.1 ec42 protein [Colletotrichum incanum]
MRSITPTIALLCALTAQSMAQNNGITPVTCRSETVDCSSTADCEAKGTLGGFPCPAGSSQNDADCWIASSSDSPLMTCTCCRPVTKLRFRA